MSNGDEAPVKLSTRTWLWLVVTIAGAAVANFAGQHRIYSDVQRQMLDLDLRWQARSERLASDLRKEMSAIREQIPPDWFRGMVEENRAAIQELERRLDQVERE